MTGAAQLDRRLTVIAVLMGTFTVSLSNTALNPAVPALMQSFGTDAATASWVLTGYMLGMALTMPLTGYLGARFGQARVYRLGLAGFLAASLAGAFSPTMSAMIAARAMQGIASGLMIPLSLALIFAVYPKDERGRITGIWSTAVMLAPALGPVLGGWLLETIKWPALFLVNLPLGLVALVVAAHGLRFAPAAAPRPFDWPGFLLCVVGISLLLGVTSGVRSADDLVEPVRLVAGLAALLCLGSFVRIELASPHPLLNLRIFAVQTYWASVVLVVVQSVGMFGCLLLVPLTMQNVLGFGAAETGFALLAAALAMSACGGLGGMLLDRYGARVVVGGGMLVSGLATLALGWVPDGAGLVPVIALMAARGLGLGFCYTPVVTAGLSAVPADRVAEGAAMSNLLRRLVASVAIVLVSVRYQLRSTDLLALGLPLHAAQGMALREGFVAIGVVILLSVPLVWLFPSSRRASSDKAQRAPAA
jgi:EmrB/QacA subfamily drug resistance transporter